MVLAIGVRLPSWTWRVWNLSIKGTRGHMRQPKTVRWLSRGEGKLRVGKSVERLKAVVAPGGMIRKKVQRNENTSSKQIRKIHINSQW